MSAEGTKDEVKGPQPEVGTSDFWFHYIGCQKPPVHPSHDCESSLAQHRSPHDHHFAPLPWSDSATLSNLSWRGKYQIPNPYLRILNMLFVVVVFVFLQA